MGVDDVGGVALPGADAVGWYEYGPVPGQAGSAVLAGHVDLNGRKGALFALRDAEAGDEIAVLLSDGSARRFEVVAVEQFAKAAVPYDALFARAGDPRLVVITCGGDFDRARRSYADNVVVTARPHPRDAPEDAP